MENCLIIINDNAGKCKKCSPEKVEKAIGRTMFFDTVHLPTSKPIDYDKYQCVAVCGGDGTLQLIMQEIYKTDKTVYYFPCGTLNDKAKAEKYSQSAIKPHKITIGKARDKVFTYVYATGAFTEIGYTAKQKNKKRFGVLAYIVKVLRAYKVHRILCKVSVCEESDCVTAEINNYSNITKRCDYAGEFALVMFIKSPRCFGFHFNHAYNERDKGGHLLMIRSPKHNGLLGAVEMFFPFFRVFFLGMKKECDGKIIFKHLSSAMLTLNQKADFCVDGECQHVEGSVKVDFVTTECKLKIINID